MGERTIRTRAADAAYAARMYMRGAPLRHVVEWYRSLVPGYLLDRPSPWMCFGAIEHVRRRLRPGMRVFEFGSGGSTLFLAEHGVELISVEHDAAWFEIVRGRLAGKQGVDYRLVEPVPRSGDPADPADPGAYASADDRYRAYSFREYVTQIDREPDGSLDVVIVDGRSRPSCVSHAIRKLAPGGMIVLDNAERAYYLRMTGPVLARYHVTEYTGLVPCNRWSSQTNVYEDRRPL